MEIRYRHKKWREKEREHESVKAQELALEQGRAAKVGPRGLGRDPGIREGIQTFGEALGGGVG